MKRSRNRRFTSALALLVIAGGAGALLWSHPDAPWLTGLQRDGAPAEKMTPTAPETASRRQPDAARVHGDRASTLRLDKAADLVVPKAASRATQTAREDSDIANNGVDAAAAGEFVESEPAGTALDLSMPADANALDLAEDDAGARDNKPARQPEPSRLALGSSADDAPTPKVKSLNLFNPDYGLRGFMKQSWINQRVAFQGGFGLDDDRIGKSSKDDDFRDNIAVGMGVILAF